MADTLPIVVHATTPERQAAAHRLAATLALPVTTASSAPVQLLVTDQHLALCIAGLGSPIAVEFQTGRAGYRRQHGGSELLAKALGLRRRRHPHIIDACAGLGQDAWVMAGLGCRVDLLERSSLVVAVLCDGLQRAAHTPEAQRMNVHCADARIWLAHLSEAQRPDVVYLDPMYPQRGTRALAGKAARALRAVVGDDADADELFVVARRCARYRVVVKRPRQAVYLGGAVPDLQYQGRSTRFDVYLSASAPPPSLQA